MAFLRRYWIQLAAVCVVVGGLVALWVVGSRGGSGSGASGVVQPTRTPAVTVAASASPTPDPAEAAVRAAATNYVAAIDRALISGTADELDSLTVAGSQARGDAGSPVRVTHQGHKTFVETSRSFLAVDVSVAADRASVVLSYDETGYDASWPALQRLAPNRTVHAQQTLQMTLVGAEWLVESAL